MLYGTHRTSQIGKAALPLAAIALLNALAAAGAAAEHAIDFARDIRPILNNACLHCHGPDPETREAGLRLDSAAEAFAPRRNGAAIVPGDPEASTLIARVTSSDPNRVMPPPEMDKALAPHEIDLLRDWIAAGAPWPEHWGFQRPEQPPLPEVQDASWPRNPIDYFVLARLEREGLAPNPEADPETLLRRLHLDLTGLPPSPKDLDAFLARPDNAAYGAAVERLLASPHYGEHWAREWLDAAQYADSDGFEKDKPRFVWAWRDWVINAFNANMPYDRFLLEQIAGDLLPDATRDQVVATGFLRNSMLNEEGGADPEQFRVEAVFNRVDVVGSSVLGLTMQCAQCHTHKFDPISHEEYFQFYAYFNNSHEANITVLSDAEEARAQAVRARVEAAEDRLMARIPGWQDRMAGWEAEVRAAPPIDWRTVALAFDDTSAAGQKFLEREDGAYLAQGYAPTRFAPRMAGPSPLQTITAVRLELLTDPNLPRGGPGRSIEGGCALSLFEFRIAPEEAPFDTFDEWERVEIASAIADVNPPRRPLGPEFPDRGGREAFTGPVAMAIDGDGLTAWTTDIGPGRSNASRHAVFILAKPVTLPEGARLAFRLHQNHGGWNSDDNQTNNLGAFRISVTDAGTLPETAISPAIEAIIRRGPEERTPEETRAVFNLWRTTAPDLALANLRIETLWRDYPAGTTQLVYRERDVPRETRVFDRGDFLAPRQRATPGVPAFLHPLPHGAPPNRLGLARWIVDRDSPVTARVYVNRVWQRYFGAGLFETPGDIGTQAPPPSHPELLDWLAVFFMDSGWDPHALHRLITGSAVYRQDAAATPERRARDPGNRLLARGARFRVEGEIVRDIALSASGLLHPAVGGPSVHPPAPAFLFEPPASYGPKSWPTSEGADRYRRGIYVFRFRSVPHPALQAFDTPPGDAPCLGRQRSNTPLQPLVTLNEPMFLEAARALAALTLHNAGPDDAARIDYAFRRCTSRVPAPGEAAVLKRFLDTQRARIARGELAAGDIALAADPRTGPEPDCAAEWAAWTLTARVILNLDETISRP